MHLRTLIIASLGLFLAGCNAAANDLAWPLPDAWKRPTPLHFGLYVTPDPKNNPIDPPERFTGYHAATDFEIFDEEKDADVPVYAICGGDIAYSGFANGYGGLVTQRCSIKGQDVTVIYGHLAPDSLPKNGVYVATGATLGILGDHKSKETDDSRKHLHLGIRKGHVSDVRGYVETESQLDAFIDPLTLLE